jgi:hypothetical protein
MRRSDRWKMPFALLFLFFCICESGASAQQDAPAVPAAKGAEAVTDVKDAAAPQNGGLPAANGSDKHADQPAVSGSQTVVVKDPKDIPERKQPNYEDWSKPELSSGMKMEAVTLLKNEQNGFTREMIEVQWRDLDPIDLWLIKPASVKNPPVILYLYSYNSTNARYKNDEFCRFVTRDGFAAVGFVDALSGERFHDRPMKDTFVNQLQEALGTTTHDVQMILNYLARRSDLDMNRVGMWGDGSGASVAIMAAAVDSRIKALDLLDPWGDWQEWLAKSSLVPESERDHVLKPIFLDTVEKLDPINYLPKLKTKQVRLQQIKHGILVTPDAVREKMEAVAPSSVNIVHYEDQKAFFTDVASKGTGFDWIKGHVGSAAAAYDSGSQGVTKAAVESKNPDRNK